MNLKNKLMCPRGRTVATFSAISAAVLALAAWQLVTLIPGHGKLQSAKSAVQKPDLREALNRQPLVFEPNVGQTDARVKYLSRGSGYSVYLTDREAVVSLKKVTENKPAVVTMKFSDRAANVAGEKQQQGITNYLVGPKSKWLTNVANYGQVKYSEVYPGVDALFYGEGTRMRYDLVVRKGSDPKQIALQFGGASDTKVNAQGNLVLTTESGDVVFEKPYVYQEVAGNRNQVQGAYRLQDDGTVGFEIGQYDRNQTLVIDPLLNFSTYLGGTLADAVNAVKADATQVYVAGQTNSPDFPLSTAGGGANGANVPAPGNAKNGLTDAFVAALNHTGTARVWATYYGGSLNDVATGIAVVAATGSVWVTGNTSSADLAGASNTLGGNQDAFVASFQSANGNFTGAATRSAYLGGANNDFGRAITVDGTGANVFVAGTTSSAVFPSTAGGAQTALGGTQDGFITKINTTTGVFTQSTYFGGSGVENINAIVWVTNVVYVTGDTTSTNTSLPISPASASNLQADNAGGQDAFFAQLPDSLTALGTMSYIGGSGTDSGTAIAWDVANSRVMIAGTTTSPNLATTAGAAQTTGGADQDAFVTALLPTGPPSNIAYSYLTYLGGVGADSATGVTVDGFGQAYVVGQTAASNFPTIRALQATLNGPTDGFVARLTSNGSAVNSSSYFGGSGNDGINGVALDPAQKLAFFVGSTDGGITTSAAAYRTTAVGATDGFVASYAYNDLTVSPSSYTRSIAFGGASDTTNVALAFTNQINPYSIGAVTYSGPTSGSACTGWLSATNGGSSAVVVKTDPTAAGCATPGSNFKGTFTIDGGSDNGPQTVIVTLNLTSTLTPPGALIRTYSKGGTNVTGVTNTPNIDNLLLTSVPNALAYTAAVSYSAGYAACAGALTITTSGTTASSGTDFTVTYNRSFLDTLDLGLLTTPQCIGNITFSAPGAANVTTAFTLSINSRLLTNTNNATPTVASTPGSLTFNFNAPGDPAAVQTIKSLGDGFTITFNAAVGSQPTSATPAIVCAAPISVVPPTTGLVAQDNTSILAPADINIQVAPTGCTAQGVFTGGNIVLTPTSANGGAAVTIPVTINIGNTIVTSPTSLTLGATLPVAGSSTSTDALPPASKTDTITTSIPILGTFNFTVSASTAALGAYAGTGFQAAASATGWLRVSPASGSSASGSNVLTISVDPTVWNGLAGSAAGNVYTGTVRVTSTGPAGVITSGTTKDIAVTFTKFSQPLVVTPTPLTFTGSVGSGLIVAQTETVKFTTGWVTNGSADFTVDAQTDPNAGGYPGFGFPADVGGVFTGGPVPAPGTASWLTISPSQAVIPGAAGTPVTVSVNLLNLAPGTYTGSLRFRHGSNTGNSFSGTNPQIVPVTLVVTSVPSVTLQPVSQTLCAGGTVTFTSTAGGFPTPTVQWQVSTDAGVTFTNIAGATTPTLSLPTVAATLNGNLYKAVFTNTAGTASSNAATLTVNTSPTVTTSPLSQTANAAASVSFTAAASGTPAATVQWQSSTDGASFTNITGATTTTLTVTAGVAGSTTFYRAVFTNTCGVGTSASASLTVNIPPTVTLQPLSQAICVGNPVIFTTAASGTPTPTVQWQLSTDGGATFANIPGATALSLNIAAVTNSQNGNQYKAVFINVAGAATSAVATLTVNTAPAVTASPASQTANTGASVTFTAAASGSPAPTVQWQSSADGGATYTNITGATTTTLTVTAGPAGSTTLYRAVFTNTCASATSAVASLTVNTAPSVTVQPVSQAICTGGGVTFTAAASGSPTPTIQWQVSTDGGATFTPIAGATANTLSFPVVTTGAMYRAAFTNVAGSANSAAATLTISVGPVVQNQPANVNTPGGAVTFTSTASGLPAPTVQWQVSTDGGATFTNITGATTTTLSVTATTALNGNRYRAVFTNPCGVDTSVAAVLTIIPGPLQLITVTPCRLLDTRSIGGFTGAFGPPSLAASTTRIIPVPTGGCNIPAGAAAYAMNVTVIPRAGGLGYLTLWPAGQAQPFVSTINSPDGATIANMAIVPAGAAGAIAAFALNDTDFVIDIIGYMVPPTAGSLQFYPLPPCRVFDTRGAAGALGGPAIAAGTSRSFTIGGVCGAPATAAAFSLNVTAVPSGPLGFITVWPSGSPQPTVSTLNSLDGTVIANAAIVGAGTGGAVSVFASNTANVVADINGYWAAPAAGGMNFFPVAPCRAVDTRLANSSLGGPIMNGGTARTFPLPASACGLPSTAKAYSLNFTVVPSGGLGFLTAWQTGTAQPVVSTLNAPKGLVLANAALIPAGISAAIDVFVTNTTQVIIDTNGYFQP